MVKPWVIGVLVVCVAGVFPGTDAVHAQEQETQPFVIPAAEDGSEDASAIEAEIESEGEGDEQTVSVAADSIMAQAIQPGSESDSAPTLAQWLCQRDTAIDTTVLPSHRFAPGVASTAMIDDAIAFHPNGRQAWVSRREGVWGQPATHASALFELEWRGDRWVEVGMLDLAAVGSVSDPFISPDGHRLYFIGPNRPASPGYDDVSPAASTPDDSPVSETVLSDLTQAQQADGGPTDGGPTGVNASDNADIWMMHWDGRGWVEPQRLGWEVNSGADEYRGSVAQDGTLYFASARPNGAGQGDLYVAPGRGEGFAPAQLLSSALNSDTGEWNISVTPDGSLALFEASSRPGNVSEPGDVYLSWRQGDEWSQAVNVRVLNSTGSDLNVSFGPSRRATSSAGGARSRQWRSWAGPRTLYYASTTAATGGDADIYQAPVSVLQRYCPGVQRQLVVVNRAGHSVDIIDLHSGGRERIDIGKGPHQAALNPQNHRLFVANYGEYPQAHEAPVDERPAWQGEDSQTVSVLLMNQTADRLRDIKVCERPHGIATERDRLWVTCETEGTVQVINPNVDTVVKTYQLEPGVHGVLKHPQQPLLFVTNPERGTVSRIDLSSGAVSALETGAGAEAMAWVDDVLWVANSRADTLSIVDTDVWFVVEALNTPGAFPIALAPTPDGREVWMAQLNGRSIAVFDAQKRLYKTTIQLNDQPLNIAFDPVTQNAFISLPRRNAVIELDRFDHHLVAQYDVGSEPDDVMVRLHRVP